MVISALAAGGLSPTQLELEITESVLLEETDATLRTLHQLRSFGIRVSLDDFGAGYSSLSYLQRFPIDKIKIDRSFVKDVETKPSCCAIVKLVIDLCRNLKLTCIVEGMETAAQVKLLRTLGCK